jgi:hypothetical protein
MLGKIRVVAILSAAGLVLYANGAWAQCSGRDVPRYASVATSFPIIAPSAAVKAGNATKVWKTITLGGVANSFALRNALDAAGCGIGDLAEEIIARPAFVLAKTKTEVDLVVATIADLGFAVGSVSLRDIYLRAEKLGLALPPAEVGPALRLQYFDQPTGEFLNVGMRPIATWNGDLVIFTVANGGAGLILIGQNGSDDTKMPTSSTFVFARSRELPKVARTHEPTSR